LEENMSGGGGLEYSEPTRWQRLIERIQRILRAG
jgi:hypothetical protein